jgi:uncharacterized membrane protein YbhN (UPF0104 family)
VVIAAAPALVADLGSSFNSFFDAAQEFFGHLADVGWGSVVIALAFYLGMLLTRTRGWFNTLQAAYPDGRVSYRNVTGAYLVGAGMNSIIPARVGDATKIFLAKNGIRRSSYAAITSSFVAQSIFDTVAGLLVFAYALSQGLLPRPPELPDLPAFEISFWANHPQFLLFTVTALGIGAIALFITLAYRAEQFWQRVKQGVVILTEPRRYVREVAAWQAASWLCRFGSFWFFLDAFHIGGSIQNVLLVMSLQAISTMLPVTPGGAGAQQALLVATLEGPSRTAVLSYSVGQQIAIAAWAVLLGFLALFIIFRTTNWRGIVRQAGEEAEEEKAAEGRRKGEGRERPATT